MIKLLIPLILIVLFASCKKDEYLCTCRDWAKGGLLVDEKKVDNNSECRKIGIQYELYPGEVRCSFNKK